MAVIVGSGTIEGGGDVVIRNASNSLVFEQGLSANGSTFSYSQLPTAPIFIAGLAVDPAVFVTLATNTWAKASMNCTTTTINRGSNYNTSTTRFTAPLSGRYLFIWNGYGRSTDYYHPAFTVNGDVTARRGTAVKLRIRGHGFQSNYDTNGQLEEIIKLVAGDYVEVYHYAGGTAQIYPFHCQFAGVYLG